MNLKQALNIILRQDRNLQRIRFTRKHRKAGLRSRWMKRWYCTNHKKVHKYIFHSIITFCPGMERMYGIDTYDEVIELAYDLLRLDMKRRLDLSKYPDSVQYHRISNYRINMSSTTIQI